ncbi:MAG: methionine synthase I (cobalamin-dependent) [Cellvibrionaceae bacterium]|jgi:methionine synthase I (cobalamin-dependent)
MANFFNRLKESKPVIIDGGTGTEMEKRGAKMEEEGWSASCTLTAPDLLRGIHEDYIKAGAEVIITNTFSTAKHVLEDCGLGHQFEEMNAAAARLARDARDNAAIRPTWVAGSIATVSFKGKPLSSKVLRNNLDRQAEILAEGGVDFFFLEMMSDTEKTQIAYEAGSKTGLPVIVGFCTHTAANGEIKLGMSEQRGPRELLIDAVQALPTDVPMVTIMHSLTKDVPASLDIIHANYGGPTGVYAHWGEFVMPNWQLSDMISAEAYANEAQKWVDAGTRMLGGCCGIGPEHIQELTRRFG